MRAIATAAFAACLVAAAPAVGAGGPTILGGVYGAGGISVPGSGYSYSTVYPGGQRMVLEKIRADGGGIARYREFDGNWSLPAVTALGDAGGLSHDGERLVLIEPRSLAGADRTGFTVVDTGRLRTERRIELDGSFSFDAISPDGRVLYLVQYADARHPLDYRVRALDVATGKLRRGAIVDPDEPDEKMTGQPVARRTSPDGRWAYTLYGGGEAPFVHALDTERGRAECIDLDRIGSPVPFTLGLQVDRSSGALTVVHKDEPVASIDPRTLAVSAAGVPAAPEHVSAADRSSTWVGPAAIAAGIAMAIVALLIALRRRRAVA